MPRNAPRSGARPNRTDLVGPRQLPVQTVPGQGYGIAAEQQTAQRTIPMAPTPMGVPGGGGGGPGPGPGQAGVMPPPSRSPMDRGAFNRPTERPNEPITAGMPTGPGPGPESLPGIGAMASAGNVDQGTVANLISSLASQPGASSAVQDLAARALGGAR